MSKNDTPTQTNTPPAGPDADGAAAATVEAAPAPAKFRVLTGRYVADQTGNPKFIPNDGFSGERMGLGFRDGVCETDDGIKAHACLELGYRVVLVATGKDAFSKEELPKGDEAAGPEPKKTAKK